MSRQRDRDEFIALMTKEGVPVDVARLVMRHGATLQRLAELECSSEAADRDRVPCPKEPKGMSGVVMATRCLCRDYGTYREAECPAFRDTPEPCPLDSMACERDHTHAGEHGDVPRIAVQAERTQARVTKLLAPYGVKPVFNGDPRGAVVKLKVPSGYTNDWGREGVCVP